MLPRLLSRCGISKPVVDSVGRAPPAGLTVRGGTSRVGVVASRNWPDRLFFNLMVGVPFWGCNCACDAVDEPLALLLTELEKAELDRDPPIECEPSVDEESSDMRAPSSKLATGRIVEAILRGTSGPLAITFEAEYDWWCFDPFTAV